MNARKITSALAVLAVVGAASLLVWSAVSTSSARVNATTTGTSFFSAGTVELHQPDARVDMLFDADGLYPGADITGCVEIDYLGSVPASVRLHAERRGGNGLDEFIDIRLRTLAADSCEATTAASADTIFDGRLSALWSRHPDYDHGVAVMPAAKPEDRLVLEAVATVVDDNGAQGLTTDFSITVEARP